MEMQPPNEPESQQWAEAEDRYHCKLMCVNTLYIYIAIVIFPDMNTSVNEQHQFVVVVDVVVVVVIIVGRLIASIGQCEPLREVNTFLDLTIGPDTHTKRHVINTQIHSVVITRTQHRHKPGRIQFF